MENYVYYIKGTLIGTARWDNESRNISSRGLVKLQDNILEVIAEESTLNLASYLREDDMLSFITVIKPGVKEENGLLYSWTRVESTQKLQEFEENKLFAYIYGQYSDGWGEGFEQQEIGEDRITVHTSEFDEDEVEFFDDEMDTKVEYFVHFYHSGMEPLTLTGPYNRCMFKDIECSYFEEEENIKRCVCPRDRMPCRG
jgi:hypothetical protein